MIDDSGAVLASAAIAGPGCDPVGEEYAWMLVRSEISGNVARINITMDESLLSAVDTAAKRTASPAAFLAEAIRGALRAP